MKKIMFNDRFGLTEAVIEKRKTVTRRLLKITQPRSLANCLQGVKYECMVDEDENNYEAPYYVGEIVAIAQNYNDAGVDFIPCDLENPRKWGCTHRMKGWNNKMFVRADLMPHQIRILGVRVERLQDITDEDCLREGILLEEKRVWCNSEEHFIIEYRFPSSKYVYATAQQAYATLIDKISGKGTWKSNPYVWRIEFELIN